MSARGPFGLAFAMRGLVRQPGRSLLGIIGIAATGALLFDMLMLSRGLVVSLGNLLEGVGFDVRVLASDAAPLSGPRIVDAAATAIAIGALSEIDDVVPLRMEEAEVEVNGEPSRLTFIGANVTVRRPWTLAEGQDLGSVSDGRQTLIVNRQLANELQLSPGDDVTLRARCVAESSVPPMTFRVDGIADFPFDQVSQLTAVTTLTDLGRACGEAFGDEADILMVASRAEHGPDEAARAIRRARPDLVPVTNDELVARFQQVEFSYFRQISAVLSAITLFFGILLITVLLSISTNQRLGEIAALRAVGFSARRMAVDVLCRSLLLVGTGGLLAIPLGLALAAWLDALLRTMPGIPANLHFFVFEPRALTLLVTLLGLTAAIAALYPVRMVARLPIAATLREEVVS
jgi:ABC-type lipoprotein release transport system permease subunit